MGTNYPEVALAGYAALAELGNSVVEIKATLVRLGIKGKRMCPGKCPIASYLISKGVGAGIGHIKVGLDSFYLAVARPKHPLFPKEHFLGYVPDPVSNFIRYFDFKRPEAYCPELDDPV